MKIDYSNDSMVAVREQDYEVDYDNDSMCCVREMETEE